MLYLILAIVTSAMISILMRLSEHKIKNNIAMLFIGYVCCSILSALYMEPGHFSVQSPKFSTILLMAAVNGCLYMGGFVLMQRSIPKNGVVLTSTYMRLGLIVCIVLSMVLFREKPGTAQTIGLCLAIGAILLNNNALQAGNMHFNSGLLLILLVSGVGDTWVKVFNEFFHGQFSDPFLLITFVAASLLCLGVMLYKKQRVGLWELVFGVAISLPNYYNSRFLLKSLQTLPGIIVYPTFSVSALLLITVLGVCFFKERLHRRQWFAMGIILVSLALLNL